MQRAVATLAVAALLVTAGCVGLGGDSADEAGTVAMYVSDQPGAIEDFEHLNVTVTAVAFHPANATGDEAWNGSGNESWNGSGDESRNGDESWVVREVDDRTVDLTRLTGENASLVGNVTVPPGEYDHVSVRVGGVDATLASGESADVHLPSERLHLPTEFTVSANETVSFVYDVRVHETGSGRYVLRPNAAASGPDQPFECVCGRDHRGRHGGQNGTRHGGHDGGQHGGKHDGSHNGTQHDGQHSSRLAGGDAGRLDGE